MKRKTLIGQNKAPSEVRKVDVCYHGRIRCWECARVQELEERVQELEQAIREALNSMKQGGAGTRTQVQVMLERALGGNRMKQTRIVEYENMPVRYHPDLCPVCKHFTGETCRIHVSNVERRTTITQTYCIRKIDFNIFPKEVSHF